MTHTDKLTVVAKTIITKFQTDAALGATSHLKAITPNADGFTIPQVQLGDIFYGDQDKLPRVPALCVEPSSKERTLKGSIQGNAMSENDMTVYILVYHAGPETQATRVQVDELAEAVELLLNSDMQLRNGGSAPTADTVIAGYVANFESGYTYRNNTLYRSVRMTWKGLTKTALNAN